MPQTIYFLRTPLERVQPNGSRLQEVMTTYGVQPRVAEHETISRRISLKNDLRWAEVANLQKLMREADFWPGFPERNLRLITAEIKAGDEPQRIDLLYLRDDGGVLPCELKIGGDDKDTHGQLIRYLADLQQQAISRTWVIEERRKYLNRVYDGKPDKDQQIRVEMSKFEEFISGISAFRLLSNTGIIVDEDFPSALVKAVRFLNERFDFEIRLLRASAFVDDDWNQGTPPDAMRLEFVDVTAPASSTAPAPVP